MASESSKDEDSKAVVDTTGLRESAVPGPRQLVLFTRKPVRDVKTLDRTFQTVMSSLPANELKGVSTDTYEPVVVAFEESSIFQPQTALRERFPRGSVKVRFSCF
jgi:hypothetical protein